MLTTLEALDYVCNTLNVFDGADEWSRCLEENQVVALNKIIRAFHFKVPFQNVGLLTKTSGTHAVPTLEEIRTDGLGCHGGLCYTNNVFFCHLLRALGFTAHHVSGTCNLKHPDNHIATVVTDVQTRPNGDKTTREIFLVDVGCGFPTLQAIPLDFSHESPVYQDIFLEYKFVKTGQHEYQRLHLQNFGGDDVTSLLDSSRSGKWERYYTFTDIPRDLDHFSSAMTEVYTDRFLRKFRVLNFSDTALTVLKEFGFKTAKLELTATHLTTETIMEESETPLHEATVMLPSYTKAQIQQAYQHWKKFLR